MRKIGRLSREKWEKAGRRGRRVPHKCLPILGPSGSGKSTAILAYIEHMEKTEKLEEEQKPVAHVTLSAQASKKLFASDILEEFQDPDFEEGTTQSLLRRVGNHIAECGTDLLIIDEIHHMVDRDRNGKTAWSVSETIKKFLINGHCPMMLVGTMEASPLITTNPQMKERFLQPIILGPLDIRLQEEKQTFLEHCTGFDIKLVEHGIFKKLSGLVSGDIPACLYEVSRGVIGTASNCCEKAAVQAIRHGRDCITREDLIAAVSGWAIPLNIIDHNPFVLGARKLRS